MFNSIVGKLGDNGKQLRTYRGQTRNTIYDSNDLVDHLRRLGATDVRELEGLEENVTFNLPKTLRDGGSPRSASR